MNIFRWDNEKNESLKTTRGVCFEQVVLLMEKGEILDTIENPNQEKYPGQKIAVLMIDTTYILFLMLRIMKRYFSKPLYLAEKPQISM